jgi:hypothetical protein
MRMVQVIISALVLFVCLAASAEEKPRLPLGSATGRYSCIITHHVSIYTRTDGSIFSGNLPFGMPSFVLEIRATEPLRMPTDAVAALESKLGKKEAAKSAKEFEKLDPCYRATQTRSTLSNIFCAKFRATLKPGLGVYNILIGDSPNFFTSALPFDTLSVRNDGSFTYFFRAVGVSESISAMSGIYEGTCHNP